MNKGLGWEIEHAYIEPRTTERKAAVKGAASRVRAITESTMGDTGRLGSEVAEAYPKSSLAECIRAAQIMLRVTCIIEVDTSTSRSTPYRSPIVVACEGDIGRRATTGRGGGGGLIGAMGAVIAPACRSSTGIRSSSSSRCIHGVPLFLMRDGRRVRAGPSNE